MRHFWIFAGLADLGDCHLEIESFHGKEELPVCVQKLFLPQEQPKLSGMLGQSPLSGELFQTLDDAATRKGCRLPSRYRSDCCSQSCAQVLLAHAQLRAQVDERNLRCGSKCCSLSS